MNQQNITVSGTGLSIAVIMGDICPTNAPIEYEIWITSYYKFAGQMIAQMQNTVE